MLTGRTPRPLPACALVAAAAVELGYFPLAEVGLLPVQGTSGAVALFLAAALAGCAAHMWVRPARAPYSGGAAVALGLLSYPLANLGGFFVGMLLALLGGSLALAWQPGAPATDLGGAPVPSGEGEG
ncbi:DUF6114 domain-containing protein [Streptomyces sp. NPDC006660]|uniref:DUF6114 domain-containing protein n=1 Tax=unclassified Streptomyces TaxID=2593676 RepID=UPI0033DA049C